MCEILAQTLEKVVQPETVKVSTPILTTHIVSVENQSEDDIF